MPPYLYRSTRRRRLERFWVMGIIPGSNCAAFSPSSQGPAGVSLKRRERSGATGRTLYPPSVRGLSNSFPRLESILLDTMATHPLGCALKILSRQNISLLPNRREGEIHVMKNLTLHPLKNSLIL
uniref:Uncharacterized protein n=1 Tax=Opuntia streptacantha TaxID=393608 RepID=A0A7C9A725_OPUST